ncbi:hypothetical protein CYLTODRAFT_414844 [Cylindrobasidium torrendii FP15055 ss-10]|uniref:Uncharacterized protein n=1 Tax=Cylindrobasidium torrendii FP15055 ss-10 TaxID=1314674 RepID=A0A0D7AWR0_9AGAR|nr:hypothetical protein CYLTODRAFT_414844 [Cylindrobasidium torrendii FP15055 ss-10]
MKQPKTCNRISTGGKAPRKRLDCPETSINTLQGESQPSLRQKIFYKCISEPLGASSSHSPEMIYALLSQSSCNGSCILKTYERYTVTLTAYDQPIPLTFAQRVLLARAWKDSIESKVRGGSEREYTSILEEAIVQTNFVLPRPPTADFRTAKEAFLQIHSDTIELVEII